VLQYCVTQHHAVMSHWSPSRTEIIPIVCSDSLFNAWNTLLMSPLFGRFVRKTQTFNQNFYVPENIRTNGFLACTLTRKTYRKTLLIWHTNLLLPFRYDQFHFFFVLLLRFIFLNIIKEKVRSKLFPIDLYLFTGQFETSNNLFSELRKLYW